jgi:hypothetical protein
MERLAIDALQINESHIAGTAGSVTKPKIARDASVSNLWGRGVVGREFKPQYVMKLIHHKRQVLFSAYKLQP